MKKSWMLVWKITWGICKICTRALESVKIRTLMGSFVQSRKGMTLKFTEELCVMTIKNNGKFEEELTCLLKPDMRNSTNFVSSTPKSSKLKTSKYSKLLFNRLLSSKYMMFELRKLQRSYVWWHWRLMQNSKEKWQKWHEEFRKHARLK